MADKPFFPDKFYSGLVRVVAQDGIGLVGATGVRSGVCCAAEREGAAMSGYERGMICFCCHGERAVTEMTDGLTSHTVCDGCREMVTVFFHVYRNMMQAVLEVAQAKRGSTEVNDDRTADRLEKE